MEGTLDWALDVYAGRRPAWRRMQARGMRLDFSWTKSAGQYVELYGRACAKRKMTQNNGGGQGADSSDSNRSGR